MDALDQVKIAKPCSASWEAMQGDDRTRFCSKCRLNVYNVAGIDRAEALALLSAGEKVCLRIYRRDDGTVITRDCPVGLRTDRRKSTAKAVFIAACLWCLTVMDRALPLNKGSGPAYADKMASWIEDAQDQLTSARQNRSNVINSLAPDMGSN